MCPNNDDKKLFDNLMQSLETGNVSKALWNDKCDYIEPKKCSNLNPNNLNFTVLQMNIRSLLANQSDLHSLLHILENKNWRIDIVILCEMHLNKRTIGLVDIPDYVHVANYRQENKGEGTSLLIRSCIPFKRRKDHEVFIEKECKTTYIEITAKKWKTCSG